MNYQIRSRLRHTSVMPAQYPQPNSVTNNGVVQPKDRHGLVSVGALKKRKWSGASRSGPRPHTGLTASCSHSRMATSNPGTPFAKHTPTARPTWKVVRGDATSGVRANIAMFFAILAFPPAGTGVEAAGPILTGSIVAATSSSSWREVASAVSPQTPSQRPSVIPDIHTLTT